jgi:DNA-binding XRE family transcriptional regulator
LASDPIEGAKEAFRGRVTTLRTDRFGSIAEAASGSGLTRQNWRKIEQGIVDDPALSSVLRIARRLELESIEELFGETPDPPTRRLLLDHAP